MRFSDIFIPFFFAMLFVEFGNGIIPPPPWPATTILGSEAQVASCLRLADRMSQDGLSTAAGLLRRTLDHTST